MLCCPGLTATCPPSTSNAPHFANLSKLGGIVDPSLAFVRTDCEQPQHLHRDVQPCMVSDDADFWGLLCAINFTNPSGPGQGTLIPHSTAGLPQPWLAVPIAETVGSATIFDSRLVHNGIQGRSCQASSALHLVRGVIAALGRPATASMSTLACDQRRWIPW